MKKIVDIIIAVLFVLFAIVQWNDPDSLLWIIMYLLVAVVAGFSAQGTFYSYTTWIFAIVLFVSICFYIPSIILWFQDGMPTISGSMKAESPYIELVREFFGLLISFVVVGYYVLRYRR